MGTVTCLVLQKWLSGPLVATHLLFCTKVVSLSSFLAHLVLINKLGKGGHPRVLEQTITCPLYPRIPLRPCCSQSILLAHTCPQRHLLPYRLITVSNLPCSLAHASQAYQSNSSVGPKPQSLIQASLPFQSHVNLHPSWGWAFSNSSLPQLWVVGSH